MNPASFEIDFWAPSVQPHGATHHVIALAGELDLYSAPSFSAEILAHLRDRPVVGDHVYVFDLTDVPFIDSTGLGAMIGVRRRITADGGEVELVVPVSSPAQTLLRITGLDRVLTVRPALSVAV